MVEDLLDYPWSSHLAYLGQSEFSWLTTQVVYDHLMQKCFPAICDDSFMIQLKQLQEKDNRPIKVTLKELIRLTCEYYKIREGDLHVHTQKCLPSMVRLVIAKLASYFEVANLTDIATYFNRDTTTFIRGLNRLHLAGRVGFDDIKNDIENTGVQA